MGEPAIVISAGAIRAFHISPDDTVKLAVLSGPGSGSSATVVFEVWEPLGSQPPNSHPDSAETFVVLSGEAVAHSDGSEHALAAGDVLILAPGSVHRIVNSSPDQPLYTITVMADDNGFADLITRGQPVELTEQDLAVLGRARLS
jgi:quercetin dioxygenase-like cupin family protein